MKNYFCLSALFFLFLFTKNTLAESLGSLACRLNPHSLTYAPEASELISCNGWSVWKYFKVSVKPEKSSSREKAYAEASIYEHHVSDSQNLYGVMKPVLTASGPVIRLTHSSPKPGHFLESIINIDTGPPMESVTWSGGCISVYSDASPCIFTISSRDFKSLAEWTNDRKHILSLSVFRRVKYPDGRIPSEERK